MMLGLLFIVLGGAAVYFTITGRDPVEGFRRALIGAAPPESLSALRVGIREARDRALGFVGIGPEDAPTETPGSTATDRTSSRRWPGAKPQLQPGLAVALAVPGSSLIRICGPGSVSGSEHPACNAADIGGSRAVLFAVQTALLAFGRAGGPIHCVIGPSTVAGWTKGAIRSRESGWVAREYTGPNSHQGHVHFSGWPSVGGGC